MRQGDYWGEYTKNALKNTGPVLRLKQRLEE